MADEPLFLRACRSEPTERTPIWLMRQAGRYMAEYRAVRSKVDFWTLCKTPELACEVTLQPINTFGFDASIVFSDLLISLPPMGADVVFAKNHGPVIADPIRTVAQIDRLRRIDPHELDYVADAIRLIVAALPPEVPLIGFAGAPFTLASYLIEGGGSKHYMNTKAFLNTEPAAAHRLFALLAAVSTDLLCLQIEAGCRVVQIFDSWAGCLDPIDLEVWSIAYMEQMIDGIRARHPNVPIIAFPKGTGLHIDRVAATGADVVGVDWTLTLDRARAIVGPKVALQGNLDPGRLIGPWEALLPAIDRVLDQAGDGTGHVFNLGHGIDPATPVDNVRRMVEHVRTESPKRRERRA